MPTTKTARMRTLAEDADERGMYTHGNSIMAITEERDVLVEALKNIHAYMAIRLMVRGDVVKDEALNVAKWAVPPLAKVQENDR